MSKILITTAIAYTNGPPHIGHMYEAILADFLKKAFQFGRGVEVKLLTGTDEHGKKIEQTASGLKVDCLTMCSSISEKFRQLDRALRVDFDYFIRTTDPDHQKLVVDSLVKSHRNGDIYLSNYKGYYNVREECFVSEQEAKELNFLDPVTQKPLEVVTEESYFFRLEKYKDHVKSLLVSGLIFPSHANNDQTRLDGLQDLSISRTSFDWGIRFPDLGEQVKSPHVVYVWFDALLNYVTGALKILASGGFDKTIHLIGKDITWFHSVIYPAILKSCGYDEYQAATVLVHGFILDKNGLKMSKSLNNVVDVEYLLAKYPLEAIRYYFVMETIWGDDIKFSEERLVSVFNNELIKNFGNIYQRLFALLKPLQAEVNGYLLSIMESEKAKMSAFRDGLYQMMVSFDQFGYKAQINTLYCSINKDLTDLKPWAITSVHDKVVVLATLLLQLDQLFVMLYPIIPDKIDELKGYLGWTSSCQLNITVDKVKAFVILT